MHRSNSGVCCQCGSRAYNLNAARMQAGISWVNARNWPHLAAHCLVLEPEKATGRFASNILTEGSGDGLLLPQVQQLGLGLPGVTSSSLSS